MEMPIREIKILIVDDMLSDALLIKKSLNALSPQGYQIQHALNLHEALQVLPGKQFDVILLDLHLPDTVEFSGLLSIQNVAPEMPVIILTAHKDEEMAIRGVEAGAQDYLFKDSIGGNDIRRAIQYAMKRKQLEGNLVTKANFDPLTGLANRPFFTSRLDMAVERNKRHPVGIGVFFLDLDRFKQVNDTMGHAAGDTLLQKVAERLKESIRPYDTAARFGGDEFAILVEDIATLEDCAAIAQKIIDKVTEPVNIRSKSVEIGVSIGIATNNHSDVARELLVQHSDEAMYVAKQSSGNCYKFYGDAKTEAVVVNKR